MIVVKPASCRHAAVALACLIACGSVAALAAPGDMEAITKASDLDRDPADAKAIATVCTACHSASQFLTASRPYLRWEQTMQDMLDRGAVATDDQLDHILSYLVKNITIVNVNTSPPDQLGMTLQIPSAVAEEIVAKRAAHPFTNLDELKAMKGLNLEVLQKLKAKGLLQF
jgi:DNA uptake protein ComE-like DNA-binding protein